MWRLTNIVDVYKFQSPKGRLQTKNVIVVFNPEIPFQSPKGRLQTW